MSFFIFCHQTFKYPKENRQKHTNIMQLRTAVLSFTKDEVRFVAVCEHQGKVAAEEAAAEGGFERGKTQLPLILCL